MLSEAYNKDILKDFESLSKVVGAAQNLSDRGWKDEVWCDDSYKETIEELYIKYLPDEAENFIPIKVDDYLEVEEKLMNFFREEIFELMK